jgi:hypothetical protein
MLVGGWRLAAGPKTQRQPTGMSADVCVCVYALRAVGYVRVYRAAGYCRDVCCVAYGGRVRRRAVH